MRSRICLEVRNTAEEKPPIGDAFVLAFDKTCGIWREQTPRRVTEDARRFTMWHSRIYSYSEPAPAYSTDQRPPTEADSTAGAVLGYGNGIQTAKEWQTVGFDRVESSHILWPFWQPMPPAPEKQKTECEKAFEIHWSQCNVSGELSPRDKMDEWSGFQAGYEAARKETR